MNYVDVVASVKGLSPPPPVLHVKGSGAETVFRLAMRMRYALQDSRDVTENCLLDSLCFAQGMAYFAFLLLAPAFLLLLGKLATCLAYS